MAKKQEESTEVATTGKTELVTLAPEKLKPAALVGMRNEMHLTREMQEGLPVEFQGSSLETLDTALPPTVAWVKAGEWVAGQYVGFEEGIGKHKSNLYHFDAKGKMFSIWGGAALDRIFLQTKQIEKGDMLLITYIGDIETEGNPCRMFDIKKAKPKQA